MLDVPVLSSRSQQPSHLSTLLYMPRSAQTRQVASEENKQIPSFPAFLSRGLGDPRTGSATRGRGWVVLRRWAVHGLCMPSNSVLADLLRECSANILQSPIVSAGWDTNSIRNGGTRASTQSIRSRIPAEKTARNTSQVLCPLSVRRSEQHLAKEKPMAGRGSDGVPPTASHPWQDNP